MFYVFRLYQTRHGLTAYTPTNRHSYGVKSPHSISKNNLNPTKIFIPKGPVPTESYMTPLMEKGLVERTDPENPMSPRQEYKLA